MFFKKTSTVSEPTLLPAKYHSSVASKLSDVIGLRNGLPALDCGNPLESSRIVRKLRMSASPARAKSPHAAKPKTRSLERPNMRFRLGTQYLYFLTALYKTNPVPVPAHSSN